MSYVIRDYQRGTTVVWCVTLDMLVVIEIIMICAQHRKMILLK